MKNEPPFAALDSEAVIRQYADMVYRLAWAYVRNDTDADDVFQEVFLRYVRRAPEFESEEHRKAWLLRVTINRAKSHLHKNRFRPSHSIESTVSFTTPETMELHESLNKLPPKYRTVIHLFYYEDCTIDEISALLNRKPATVRTQLTRARQMLTDQLKQEI